MDEIQYLRNKLKETEEQLATANAKIARFREIAMKMEAKLEAYLAGAYHRRYIHPMPKSQSLKSELLDSLKFW